MVGPLLGGESLTGRRRSGFYSFRNAVPGKKRRRLRANPLTIDALVFQEKSPSDQQPTGAGPENVVFATFSPYVNDITPAQAKAGREAVSVTIERWSSRPPAPTGHDTFTIAQLVLRSGRIDIGDPKTAQKDVPQMPPGRYTVAVTGRQRGGHGESYIVQLWGDDDAPLRR